MLHSEIENSRFYAANSKSLVIQGDGSRNRTDNVQNCYKKLYNEILTAGRVIIKGETSPEQAERVRNLYVVLPTNGAGQPNAITT